MTRLERPIVVRAMRAGAPPRFVLQPGTWSPFNSRIQAIVFFEKKFTCNP